MNSLWLVITALAAFLVAYRLYGAFLAAKVAVLNDARATPAHRLRDGVDYHPTKRIVLFGHHFAAIAGPGPLIGPVLASQWGYFPGFAWIVIGACLAGGVHDFVVLTASVRNDGLTLPKIARQMIGPVAGSTTAVATLFIVVAVLASVAMVVVKALSHSSWGMFTILVTIPAALLTGAWMYKIRPGRVGEASAVGVTIVMLGVILGKPFADTKLGDYAMIKAIVGKPSPVADPGRLLLTDRDGGLVLDENRTPRLAPVDDRGCLLFTDNKGLPILDEGRPKSVPVNQQGRLLLTDKSGVLLLEDGKPRLAPVNEKGRLLLTDKNGAQVLEEDGPKLAPVDEKTGCLLVTDENGSPVLDENHRPRLIPIDEQGHLMLTDKKGLPLLDERGKARPAPTLEKERLLLADQHLAPILDENRNPRLAPADKKGRLLLTDDKGTLILDEQGDYIIAQPRMADVIPGDSLIFSEQALSILLPLYAMIASILPVWVLMCPRDYLSSYMKIGVIVVLAAGIFVAQPTLAMPSTTPFLAGGGPVVSGAVWPFVCIVIMCGALSGFHALIASGTTPKMINKESDIRPIGYGAMVLEGFVALTALVAACALDPGDYFRINSPQKTADEQKRYVETLARMKNEHQWDLTPGEMPALAADLTEGPKPEDWQTLRGPMEEGVKEKLGGRTGGAVTLAVGMAKVFSSLPGMKELMAYWYHFVIMFEALFILTLLETGTRVARFVFQETVAQFNPKYALGGEPKWGMNVVMSIVVCGLWGGLLYIGNLDTLWRMLGIANQLLATIALCVGTVYLLKHAPKRVYALCTALPLVFAVVTVFTAGVQSILMWWAEPETDSAKLFLMKLACALAAIMLALSAVIVAATARSIYATLRAVQPEEEEELAAASAGSR